MFEKPESLWEKQLNVLFKNKNPSHKDYIFKIVSLALYSNINNTDLIELYHLLPLDHFIKVITLFSGRKVDFIEKNKLKDCIILAIVYYEVEKYKMKGYTKIPWKKIKQDLNLDFCSISMAMRIKNLDNWLRQRAHEIITKELRRLKNA